QRQIDQAETAGPKLAQEEAWLRSQRVENQRNVDARVKARQPALDALATTAANLFFSPDDRGLARHQLQDLFARSPVAAIPDDKAFATVARGLAESYYLNSINYPYLDYERDAFQEWTRQYLGGLPVIPLYPTETSYPRYTAYRSNTSYPSVFTR